MDMIRLTPVFKQMIWGGNKLRDDFKYPVDFDNCGECWGISAHPIIESVLSLVRLTP